MSGERLSMRGIREVLRLRLHQGLPAQDVVMLFVVVEVRRLVKMRQTGLVNSPTQLRQDIHVHVPQSACRCRRVACAISSISCAHGRASATRPR